ncbi:Sugar transporter ERD6-like 7 [Morus notabilis]|uniref:Sugar transporter ERD6-like 7 n=1 Tax=Morus notabilis TaxID=981085 RepID=W9SLW0_9ROSA|nr:Sugar transporter ERD6-like 7 [Morus notabilis]
MTVKEKEDEVREPLRDVEDASAHEKSKNNPWMVYLSTLVAVCGSYEFGACAGYSSPTQSAIREDLILPVGSIVTFGAMIGAIRSGLITDLVGRKGGALALDIGRLATGYGIGAFSYVAKAGRQKEFEASTAETTRQGYRSTYLKKRLKSRGNFCCLQDYITTLEQLPKANMLDLFQRRYLRSLNIGLGLMVCQQFGGINAICFYTSSIFESAGFSSKLGTIIYAILQLVVTGLSAAVIDKVGRKPLLLVHELALQASPILAVIGILLYIGSYSVGMGAVPWVMMSEIFSINIKGQAGSLATLMNWFGAWFYSYSFNFLMAWSSYGTFILYAAINALAILFIITVVPETKGKTLEQIQAAINV